ncbi:MAG: L,D-transpeptidase family protein [Pseudomonadota bacterium]
MTAVPALLRRWPVALCTALAMAIAMAWGSAVHAEDVVEDAVLQGDVAEPWYTIEERLAQYGPSARARMRDHFDAASVAYPPGAVVLVALKAERRVELYAGDTPESLAHIRDYPVYGASGGAGPKLRAGDRQVPEGLYRIEGLNPNSHYHLSLRVNYPNAFDRSMAAREGRTGLGGDIYIHGGMESVGCLAMGDRNSEDLFVLAADVGEDNIRAVFSPLDFRVSATAPEGKGAPRWAGTLYQDIWRALDVLPRPGVAEGQQVLRFFPQVSVADALGFEQQRQAVSASGHGTGAGPAYSTE